MKIVLGICGSISAYKAVDILRLFQKNGHEASVVLTANAARIVTPFTFETFVPGKVHTEMWDTSRDLLAHIHLPQEHDLLLVAPASAGMIGKMAAGIADDLLSSLYLACDKPVIIAPAMNTRMYVHPAVRENLERLRKRGVRILEPGEGSLACGDEGPGRLPDSETIYRFCLELVDVQ